MTSDGDGNLYIADFENSRVLEFTPSAPGNFGANPTAGLVFGQGSSGTNSTSNFCNGNSSGTALSATSLCLPVGITTDPSGNLYVADGNSRVLEYDEGTQPPANVTACRVFGQSDFTHSGCNDGTTNGSGATHDLILTNPNTVPLSIRKVGVFTTSTARVNQFVKVADGCADSQLAVGAQCAISVTFDPGRLGKITGVIRIHDDARHSPQKVYLQGHGE